MFLRQIVMSCIWIRIAQKCNLHAGNYSNLPSPFLPLNPYNIFFILFITDFLLQFNRLHILPNACIKWFDFSTFDNIKTTLVYLLYFHDFLRALWSIRLLGMYLSSWSHKWPPAFRKIRLEHTSSKSIIYVLWGKQSYVR